MWSNEEIIKINQEMFESMPTFLLKETKKGYTLQYKEWNGRSSLS